MFFILLNTKTVRGWLQEDEHDMDVDTTTHQGLKLLQTLLARVRDLLLFSRANISH